MHAKLLQLCLTLCDLMDYSLLGFSVHGFSRQEYWSELPCSPPGESFQPRDGTCVSYVSCISRWILYHWCHLGSPQMRNTSPEIKAGCPDPGAISLAQFCSGITSLISRFLPWTQSTCKRPKGGAGRESEFGLFSKLKENSEAKSAGFLVRIWFYRLLLSWAASQPTPVGLCGQSFCSLSAEDSEVCPCYLRELNDFVFALWWSLKNDSYTSYSPQFIAKWSFSKINYWCLQ